MTVSAPTSLSASTSSPPAVSKDLRLSVAMGQSSCSSLTTASVHKSRASHTWQISGFSQLPRNVHKPLSTSFQMDGVQWELRLFAYGENDDEQISLFLHYKHGCTASGSGSGAEGQVQAPSTVTTHTTSTSPSSTVGGSGGDVTAKFQFKLLSTNGQCDYVKGTNGRAFTFNAQKSAFGCPLLIHRTTLFNNPYLIHDDTLVLVTEIEMACNLQLTEGRFSNTNTGTVAHQYQSHNQYQNQNQAHTYTPMPMLGLGLATGSEQREQAASPTASTGSGSGSSPSPCSSRCSSASKHLEVLGMDMRHCISTRPDVYLLPIPLPMQSAESSQCSEVSALPLPLDAELSTPTTTPPAATAVPAHRVILAARSAVFRAMFSASYAQAEADSGCIQLPGIDHATLSLLVHYIYTGQLLASEPLSWQQLCLLFEAAVRYDVELLTELCAHQLSLLLSRDNILQTLQLADTYKAVAGAQLLKQAAKTLFLVQFDDMIQAVALQHMQHAMAADVASAGSMLLEQKRRRL